VALGPPPRPAVLWQHGGVWGGVAGMRAGSSSAKQQRGGGGDWPMRMHLTGIWASGYNLSKIWAIGVQPGRDIGIWRWHDHAIDTTMVRWVVISSCGLAE
jgi:hypothetical protein